MMKWFLWIMKDKKSTSWDGDEYEDEDNGQIDQMGEKAVIVEE